MTTKSISIKEFTEDFFKKIGAKTHWKEKILNITNVPEKLEQLYGKKCPYKFVFDIKERTKETDLITKGCTLIKVMSDYLNDKAKNTLVKLDLDYKIDNIINSYLNFDKFTIINTTHTKKNDYIVRFTFATTYQYLNEKETFLNNIYIHDKNVIKNFSLECYKTNEGSKSEVDVKNMKSLYAIAKSNLINLLKDSTNKIRKKVNMDMEIAINRIKSHFVEQRFEIIENINSYQEKIRLFKSDLKKADFEKHKLIIAKIKRINNSIKKLQSGLNKKSIDQEKEFFIQDEKHKHSLNITNTLINSTVIYYPILTIRYKLKSKNNISLPITSDFNPLTKKIIKPKCLTCNKFTNNFEICSTGHITCLNCIKNCPSCIEPICNKCTTNTCKICKKETCSCCKNSCKLCRKNICSNDLRTDFLTEDPICIICSKSCNICNNATKKEFFAKCIKCKKLICPKCQRKELIQGKPYTYCNKCYKGPSFLMT